MKINYTLAQQFIVRIILIVLCLQSCGGSGNLPIQEDQAELLQTDTQQTIPHDVLPLTSQALTVQAEHNTTFYQQAGGTEGATTETESLTKYNKLRSSLKDIISNSGDSGRTKIANQLGISYSTLTNFVYGRTKRSPTVVAGCKKTMPALYQSIWDQQDEEITYDATNSRKHIFNSKTTETIELEEQGRRIERPEQEQAIGWLHELESLGQGEEKEEPMKHPFDKDLADCRNLMEDFSNPTEQGVKRPVELRVSSNSDTEGPQQKKRRSEEIRENPFERCPEEIMFVVLELAARSNYLSDGNTGSIEFVCRDWQGIMEQKQMKKSIASIKDEYIYQKFLKGVLVYRPDEESDEGRIDLPIASLVNPLEGTFDLSQCGDTGEYLSISTGYRKGKKAENAKKLKIWLTPRFLVEKEIEGSAQHLKKIFPSKWPEEASIGILWTLGKWDNMRQYDYLTDNTMEGLGDDNLYEKHGYTPGDEPHQYICEAIYVTKKFHIHFVN
jgi:hypothetical protein